MLSKLFVKAAKAAVSRDMTRRRMTFIRILKGWAAATNGHVLVAEKTDSPDAWINPEALNVAEAIVSRNGSGVHVTQRKKGQDVQTHHTDLDEEFPRWRDVLPGGWDTNAGTSAPAGYEFVAAFNPKLLIDVLTAFDSETEPGVVLFVSQNGTSKNGMVIRSNDGRRVAMIMPQRVD